MKHKHYLFHITAYIYCIQYIFLKFSSNKSPHIYLVYNLPIANSFAIFTYLLNIFLNRRSFNRRNKYFFVKKLKNKRKTLFHSYCALHFCIRVLMKIHFHSCKTGLEANYFFELVKTLQCNRHLSLKKKEKEKNWLRTLYTDFVLPCRLSRNDIQ